MILAILVKQEKCFQLFIGSEFVKVGVNKFLSTLESKITL